MTRKGMLENAIAIVTGENVADEGQGAEDTFGHIAQFWSDYLGFSLTDFDVCMMIGAPEGRQGEVRAVCRG